MIEYPSIDKSNKAPRKECIAFDKLDGFNMRFKWTNKQGFCLFGTRTQLIEEKAEIFGKAVTYFLKNQGPVLDTYFKKEKEYRNVREIIVFGEFFGPNSFAGVHNPNDNHKVIVFDILIGHKNKKFIKPNQLVKEFGKIIELPAIIYRGNLNDQFISDIKENKYNLNEGVIVKGIESDGAYMGGMWTCKIKTKAYLDKIFNQYGEEGLKKFGE